MCLLLLVCACSCWLVCNGVWLLCWCCGLVIVASVCGFVVVRLCLLLFGCVWACCGLCLRCCWFVFVVVCSCVMLFVGGLVLLVSVCC